MADVATRTDLDFAAYRAQLTELQQSVATTQSRMATQDADGLNTTGADRAESSVTGNHPADLGTEVQLRGQDAALEGNERAILHQIERALAKIDDGTYGLSDVSGEAIPKERLDAVPYASLTIAEAEAYEPQ